MEWSGDVIRLMPADTLVEGLIEMLSRTGFREVLREYKRGKSGKRRIRIVAERDDPISGKERLVIFVYRNEQPGETDGTELRDAVFKFPGTKVLVLGLSGFSEKFLKVLDGIPEVSLKDAEWVAELFNRYGVEPPRDIVEKLLKKIEEVPQEKIGESIRPFTLDAPLFEDYSLDDIVSRISAVIKYRCKVDGSELTFLEITPRFVPGYILSWTTTDGKRSDKAIFYPDGRVIPKTADDLKLKGTVMRVLLNDVANIKATHVEVEDRPGLEEATALLKKSLVEIGVSPVLVEVKEAKKVYFPKEVEVLLKVGGENEGRAIINYWTGKVKLDIEPFPKEELIKKAIEAVVEKLSEKPIKYEFKRWGSHGILKGKTKRFEFEVTVNVYSGKVTKVKSKISEISLEDIISTSYPDGYVLNIERTEEKAIADILTKDSIAILEINLSTGNYRERERLLHPLKAFEIFKESLTREFPIRDPELKTYHVIGHRYIELEMTSRDGSAIAKIDGRTGEIIGVMVQISRSRIKEILAEKYPGFEIVLLEETKNGYLVTLEDKKQMVKVEVSSSGRIVRELDRFLKSKVAEEIARNVVSEIEERAIIDNLKLTDNWIAEFIGPVKRGKIVIHRATGEVLSKDIHLTEKALERIFEEHIRRKYGEKKPKVDRVIHHLDRGYATIKMIGKRGYYYAKINTRTGEIMEEDTVSLDNLTSKLKVMQLEAKYR